MKTIHICTAAVDAQLFADRLQSDGFNVVVNGAREYSSVVLGGIGEGRYELQVPEDEAEEALKALKEYMTAITADDENEIRASPQSSLKKSVALAGLGVSMVPVIFNYYSIKHAITYARLENNFAKKIFWLSVIATLNALGVVVPIILFRVIVS